MEVVFAPHIQYCPATSSAEGIITVQPKGGMLMLLLQLARFRQSNSDAAKVQRCCKNAAMRPTPSVGRCVYLGVASQNCCLQLTDCGACMSSSHALVDLRTATLERSSHKIPCRTPSPSQTAQHVSQQACRPHHHAWHGPTSHPGRNRSTCGKACKA